MNRSAILSLGSLTAAIKGRFLAMLDTEGGEDWRDEGLFNVGTNPSPALRSAEINLLDNTDSSSSIWKWGVVRYVTENSRVPGGNCTRGKTWVRVGIGDIAGAGCMPKASVEPARSLGIECRRRRETERDPVRAKPPVRLRMRLWRDHAGRVRRRV